MRFYSTEWVAAFNRIVTELGPKPTTEPGQEPGPPPSVSAISDPGPEGTRADLEAPADGTRRVADYRLLQLVHGGPEGTIRIGLESAAGRVLMTRDPPEHPEPQVTLSVAYDDAAALSRGELEPGRLIATGRVKVRGDLSILIGAQALLTEIAARVSALSGRTEY